MNGEQTTAVNILKIIATSFIWLWVAIMGLSLGGFADFAGFVLMIAAALAINFMLWGGMQSFSIDGLFSAVEKGKSKNNDLQSALMLLEMLDEKERLALKKRLINKNVQIDGEYTGEILEASTPSH